MMTVVRALAIVLALSAAIAQPAAPSLVLADVTLLNPADGGALRPHVDIVVRGREIAEIRPHPAKAADGNAEHIDLAGTFALPGFVDMHAHVLLSPRDPVDGHVLPRPAEATTRAMLDRLLDYGVTTVRDPGDPTEAVVALRNAIADGRISGPTMFVAGRILNGSAPGPEPKMARPPVIWSSCTMRCATLKG